MRVLNGFDYIYLITGVFGTYIIYRFMGIFFDNKEVDKKREIISYTLYFLIISIAYLFFNIPVVTMLLNLLMFFIISLNYKATMRKRIISAFLIYIILVMIELVVVLISGYLDFSLFTRNIVDDSIIGHIAIKIITFITVLFMENYTNIKKRASLPLIYQITVIFIPLGSLYIVILLLYQRVNIDSYLIVFGIAILFLLNINIFYLYDVLNKNFEEKFEALFLEGQNKYYKNQLEIMGNNEKHIKALHQDLNRHLQVLRSYISKDKKAEALEYIEELTQETYKESEISSSGNVDIDSILNYKLKHAISKGIKISLKNNIPPNINISSIDIVTVLGNLIDNAVETTTKRFNNRQINIKIKLQKGVLFISVNYTYKEDLITAKNKKKYVMKFNNIEKILKKYNGMMIINHTKMEFNVDLLMYMI